MKKNTVLTIIIIILVLVIIGGGIIFYLTSKNTDNKNPLIDASANKNPSNGYYTDKDFKVKQPENWQSVSMPNTLAAFINPDESFPEDSPADRIKFNSYIAISFDNAQQRTFNEFVEFIKQETKKLVPSAAYTKEVEKEVNGQQANFIELKMTQQDINFKVLVVAVNAQDKYYLISCNTTTDKWDQYKDLFYSIAESFELVSQNN